MQRPRVLLIDDTPEIVEYCSELLNEDYDVVGTASDGWAEIDLCAALDPDVIVLDICLRRLDGVAVLTVLRSFGCRANIVLLSSDGSLAENAIDAGGEAFVWKIALSRTSDSPSGKRLQDAFSCRTRHSARSAEIRFRFQRCCVSL